MKKFFENSAFKLQRFMYGRYGIDQLYKALFCIYLIIMLLGIILGRTVDMKIYSVVSVIDLAIIVYTFYRVFSKKIDKRRKENEKWLSLINSIKKRFRISKDRWKFRKTHIFRKCPCCKSVLRLKKIKGSHNVSCPNCKNNFKIKVFF